MIAVDGGIFSEATVNARYQLARGLIFVSFKAS